MEFIYLPPILIATFFAHVFTWQKIGWLNDDIKHLREDLRKLDRELNEIRWKK